MHKFPRNFYSEFGVTRSCIKDWKKKEPELMRLSIPGTLRLVDQNARDLMEVVAQWVERAWRELSEEVIIKSLKACALTTATDGSEDHRITCFKPDGSIGPRGLDILRGVRAQEMAQDGQHDYEEAGNLEDEEKVVLENVNENEELYFN